MELNGVRIKFIVAVHELHLKSPVSPLRFVLNFMNNLNSRQIMVKKKRARLPRLLYVYIAHIMRYHIQHDLFHIL